MKKIKVDAERWKLGWPQGVERRVWYIVPVVLGLLLIMMIVIVTTKDSPKQSTQPDVPRYSSFDRTIMAMPGLTHYYPLNEITQTEDVVGGVNGVNHGVSFIESGAVFNGESYIELPDNPDYSVDPTGELSILVFQTVTDWRGRGGNGEYINWMGKGEAGHQEWAFRHYVYPGGTGEAPERPKRTSFYHFNPDGDLGAGSFFQDDDPPGKERMINAQADMETIEIWKDGALRERNPLSQYDITPENMSSPVRIGTRGPGSGFLVGHIRRVAFFDRKLSSEEIALIYRSHLS